MTPFQDPGKGTRYQVSIKDVIPAKADKMKNVIPAGHHELASGRGIK